jgi:Protein of unknown function (DUF1566)
MRKLKRSFLVTLGLMVALGQGITSRVEAGPPEWSQKLTGASRFKLVLDSAAVLDKETNLVWEKSPDTNTRNWFDASFFCNNRSVGVRKGWRLPTIQELASLVDPSRSHPALPANHPFTNLQFGAQGAIDGYWSATSDAVTDSSRSARVIQLDLGDVNGAFKAEGRFVWCLRGGHGGPDFQ